MGKPNSPIRRPSTKAIVLLAILVVAALGGTATYFALIPQVPPEEIVLRATLSAPQDRWDFLLPLALEELRANHPDKKINIDYEVLPYAQARTKLFTLMAGEAPRDLVAVDVIWLGELAEGGFLMDMTDMVNEWGRINEWYPTNAEGSKFNGRFYGIWTWTDVRVLWYWRDLLTEAGVNPGSLRTWDGYIAAAKKLNSTLRPLGIEGAHLSAIQPDMWYPYLWMLGGEILELKEGHPTRGQYWYPAYHGPEGVKALTFIKDQVRAGIKPQTDHFWGEEFANKKFAVMLEGSWLLSKFPRERWPVIAEEVGMLPLFPVPEEGVTTSTLMGGWVLSIPTTSEHPELAWELMTTLQDPEILAQMLSKFAYLPTQRAISEGEPFKTNLSKSIPFFDELATILPHGRTRPNIPEYPQIAEHIRIAIEQVYFNGRDPADALRDAAEKSAMVLGWPGLQGAQE